MEDITICCADIGSIKRGKFAWASDPDAPDHDSSSIRDLSSLVVERLDAGDRVALGFECPLWLPIPANPAELGKQREGENGRPWSAGAGAFVLTTGLAQVAWILDEVRQAVPNVDAFLDWRAFCEAPRGIFLWEAFVTGDAKGGSHSGDAQVAIQAFRQRLPMMRTDVTTPHFVRSLIGDALLRSGWSTDASLLRRPCVVVRA